MFTNFNYKVKSLLNKHAHYLQTLKYILKSMIIAQNRLNLIYSVIIVLCDIMQLYITGNNLSLISGIGQVV